MIEEQFVSFDTARMLKEAGFDVPCTSQYTENEFAWENLRKTDFNKNGYVFSRPTQALAARWLREVYGIMIVSFFDDYMSKWYYVIDGVKKQSVIKCVQSASDYDNYEEAIESGLKHSLELIKK